MGILKKSASSAANVTEVYEQIKSRLLKGSWMPDELLPDEEEFCRMLNARRSDVKTALGRLRHIGIVSTRYGKGTYVSESFISGMATSYIPILNLSEKEFSDMTEFRESIEFRCIDLAAQRANENDLRRIELALNRMIASRDDYERYSFADYDFHLAIARASKNEMLYTAMRTIRDQYCFYLEELNRVFGNLKSVDAHIEQYRLMAKRENDHVKELIKQGIDDNIVKIRERMQPESARSISYARHISILE